MRHNILVTGGSGFIGTHLCRTLAAGGHQVKSLDLVPPKEKINYQYEQGDVRDQKTIKRMLHGVDTVFHLAAIASVPRCQEEPTESYATNLLSTCLILDEIEKQMRESAKPIKIIFASSSAVYGKESDNGKPNLEENSSRSPLSLYAAQKLGSEHAIQIFHLQKKIPAIIFRFFNVYGPGQDPSSQYSGVISIFAKCLETNSPIKLNGGGNQTRDFISVHDVVRAGILAMELENSKCSTAPINLGTGKSIEIKALAEMMMKVKGTQVPTQIAPHREGDIIHSFSAIERAKTILQWAPQTSLESGLREILAQ